MEEAETRLEQIEARLALLGTTAERVRLAVTVIDAREDWQLEKFGQRAGAVIAVFGCVCDRRSDNPSLQTLTERGVG